jgi:hypothetical protein
MSSAGGTLTYNITGTPSGSGTASFAINIGGKTCTLTRTVFAVGTIATAFNCGSATNNGTLTSGIAASSVSSVISYTNGNGGTHNGQTVTSTGVTGLTATLSSGTFANGSGTLTYNITGTPSAAGTATFAINIGGQTCNLTRTVSAGAVYCSGTGNNPTTVVEITSTTGKVWMDRNLGASRAATSATDAQAYGDLYQWGRGNDGHQCRNSGTTTVRSSLDQPGNGNFILSSNNSSNWRITNNHNLWQGVNGINNPCPSGFRLATETEWQNETISPSWGSGMTASNFYSSVLKLPSAGARSFGNGSVFLTQFNFYWTSTVNVNGATLSIESTGGDKFQPRGQGDGYSVRCIKN